MNVVKVFCNYIVKLVKNSVKTLQSSCGRLTFLDLSRCSVTTLLLQESPRQLREASSQRFGRGRLCPPLVIPSLLIGHLLPSSLISQTQTRVSLLLFFFKLAFNDQLRESPTALKAQKRQ